jgi:hypothetical protein
VAAWFAGAPLLFRTLVDPEPLRQVLDDSVPDIVLFGAVLLIGEAMRNRRALDVERERSERLLLNVLPDSIAARLKQTERCRGAQRPLLGLWRLTRQQGLEKIKTIGDAYMVVG